MPARPELLNLLFKVIRTVLALLDKKKDELGPAQLVEVPVFDQGLDCDDREPGCPSE